MALLVGFSLVDRSGVHGSCPAVEALAWVRQVGARSTMHPRNLNPAQTLPWRSWYNLQSWRRRAKHQLRNSPLCVLCLEAGKTSPATIADHHPPHKGDYNAFILGSLRSLCKECHDGLQSSFKHKGYSSAIGVDGYPLDSRHPWYRER